MIEAGVINLEGHFKVAVIFGQTNEPPGARARVALTGLTIEEYYISVTWRVKVSCCSLTTSSVSHKRVPSEVSALLGRILSAISDQLTLSMDMDDR
jgi:F0F1-type ATP synthase beta subunit